jgi:multiple sugar transport system permease protein
VKNGSEVSAGFAFVLPALLLLLVFFFLPVIAALLLSLTDFDLYAIADPGNIRFVWFSNYVRLLQTPDFWVALRNTFYFVLVGGPLSVMVSLGAALLLNAKAARFKSLFRTIYFAPVVTTLVAVAVVWRYMYHSQYGLLNWGLEAIGIDLRTRPGDHRSSPEARRAFLFRGLGRGRHPDHQGLARGIGRQSFSPHLRDPERDL